MSGGDLTGLLSHQLRGEHRAHARAAVMLTFIVGQHAQRGCQTQQLILCQTEFPPPWMPVTYIVVDRKGFIEQDALRL
jgi:hypothetical protein